jgi:hypothetical protein
MTKHTKAKKPTIPKVANKTIIICTDTDAKCKGVILQKTDAHLVVDLPTGFQMTLNRLKGRKLYAFRVGTLEFISDGWETT